MSETLREVFVYGVVRPINHPTNTCNHISIKAFIKTFKQTHRTQLERSKSKMHLKC